jgi:hypothetical protein
MYGTELSLVEKQCLLRVADAIIWELQMEDELAAYIDDALSIDPTEQLCLDRAVKIVKIYTKYKIIINQKKSYFNMYAIPALGWIVDGNDQHLHPSKVEKIISIKFPETPKQMKGFLGLCIFIRDCLPHWSIITQTLDQAASLKKIPDTQELRIAFQTCKDALTTAVNLVTEDPNKEVILTTHASEVGLGFTQAQVKDKYKNIPTAQLKEHQLDVVRFGSVAIKTHTLKVASPTMRELAGSIFAIKKC